MTCYMHLPGFHRGSHAVQQVLTTYAVLESCFRKQESGFKRKGRIIKEKSPVHQIHWHRIIVSLSKSQRSSSLTVFQLDEAHNIKERATNTAKATFELQGTFRWCLSGTPLQNRVGELYSLVRFLGGDPFSYYFCESLKFLSACATRSRLAMKASAVTVSPCTGSSRTSEAVMVSLAKLLSCANADISRRLRSQSHDARSCPLA